MKALNAVYLPRTRKTNGTGPHKKARRQLVGFSRPHWMRLNSPFQCSPRAVCHLSRPLIVGTGVWSPYLRHISRLLALVSSFHIGLKDFLKEKPCWLVCLFNLGCSRLHWMRPNSPFQCSPRAVCHLSRPLIVGTGVWSPYLRHISRLLALVSSFHIGLKDILKEKPNWGIKGQIISKWFFGVFDFLQKTNENKSTWGIIVVESN